MLPSDWHYNLIIQDMPSAYTHSQSEGTSSRTEETITAPAPLKGIIEYKHTVDVVKQKKKNTPKNQQL